MFWLALTTLTSVGCIAGYFWRADRREAREGRARRPVQDVALLVSGGFRPDRLVVRPGHPIRIRLTRAPDGEAWWDDFEFPYHRVLRELPEGETITVGLGPLDPGEYALFARAGSLRGSLAVQDEPGVPSLAPGPALARRPRRSSRPPTTKEPMSMPTRSDALRTLVITAALSTLLTAPGRAQSHSGMHSAHHAPTTDSAAVAGAVHAYHAALQGADTAKALDLLADDVLVVESGSVETRAEYLAHHLPADMAFAAALPHEMGPIAVTIAGDVAWAVSTSRTRGTYHDRPIDSVGAELTVLSRHAGAWRIRAIHWSSHPAR